MIFTFAAGGAAGEAAAGARPGSGRDRGRLAGELRAHRGAGRRLHVQLGAGATRLGLGQRAFPPAPSVCAYDMACACTRPRVLREGRRQVGRVHPDDAHPDDARAGRDNFDTIL